MNKILAMLLFFALAATAECALWVPQETGRVAAAAITPATPATSPLIAVAPTALATTTASSSNNTWVNSQTCGWVASTSSYPWTCNEEWHCATNAAHVVGCVSGTYSPLFSVCFDQSAVAAAGCSDPKIGTGCCSKTDFPACGTYLWTGVPARSMYRCFPTTTVVKMLDEPQFVLDSRTNTSTSSSRSNSTTSDGVVASPAATPGSPGSDTGGGGGSSIGTSEIIAISIGGALGFFVLLAARQQQQQQPRGR
ncbi:Aurofusarin cluster transcription factor aurR2 [Apiospora arundinis]